MRRLEVGCVASILAIGLWSCNRVSHSDGGLEGGKDKVVNTAPVLTPGLINAPVIDTPRVKGGPLAEASEPTMIPQGSTIRIRNNEAISLQTAEPGQTFSGVVARDVFDSKGKVAIPRGSAATLVVFSAKAGAERVLDIAGVEVAGRRYGLEAMKRGDASAKGGRIPAATLLSFRLDETGRIREIP